MAATKKSGRDSAPAANSSDPRSRPAANDSTGTADFRSPEPSAHDNDEAMHAAVLHALALGLDVHWLWPVVLGDKGTGKAPVGAYAHRAVQIDAKALWKTYKPGFGLGMRTGRNLVYSFDYDPPADPAERAKADALVLRLLSLDGTTLPAPTVRTGGGGMQWHIRVPEGTPPLGGVVLFEGSGEHEEVRFIGAGCNAVLPPTLHYKGTRYGWGGGGVLDATPALLAAVKERSTARVTDADVAGLEPEELELADLSEPLRKQIEAAGEKEDRSKGIYAVVCALRESGYSPAHALWLITDSGLPLCSKAAEQGPEWAAREVLRIWRKHADRQQAQAEADFASPPSGSDPTPGGAPRFVLTKASDLMRTSRDRTYETALGVACPIGVVMLAGIGGAGKSTIAATFAAHVTNGVPCPPWEGKATVRSPAGVLWLTTEEDPDAIVFPRHEALGGDCDLLFVPKIRTEVAADGVHRAVGFDLQRDLPSLLQQARDAGTPIRLVVCDALPSLVDWEGRASNSDTDVKQLIADLSANVCLRYRVCILGIGHWNKKADLPDEYRMSGAQAWRESPRLSFVCKGSYVYVNKANDLPEFGCEYEQQVVKDLYTVEAETEAGRPMVVTARRAKFGACLLDKAKVLGLLADERALGPVEAKAPSRLDRMAATVASLFDVLDDDVAATTVWDAVQREHGTQPNGAEKKAIAKAVGVEFVAAGKLYRKVRAG
jgi:hypothetical protein